MAAPWEQFSSSAEQKGPWSDYQTTTSTEDASIGEKALQFGKDVYEQSGIPKVVEAVMGAPKKGGLVDPLSAVTKPETLTTDVSKQIGAPVIKTMARDPNMVNSQNAADYILNTVSRGIEGGAAGFMYSPFTGPGSTLAGTSTGLMQGFLETVAKDLGYNPDVQEAVGMVGPGAISGAKGAISQSLPAKPKAIMNSEITASLRASLGEALATKIFGYTATKVGKGVAGLFKEQAPVDVPAAERSLGMKGAVKEPSLSEEAMQAADASLRQRYEAVAKQPVPEGVSAIDHVYNLSGQKINEALRQTPFVGSSGFNKAASLEGKFSKAQAEDYTKLFQDNKGNALAGQKIIDNLRAFKYGKTAGGVEGLPEGAPKPSYKARFEEGAALEKRFNAYLQEQTGQPWQAHARAAYEEVATAKARDELPKMFAEITSATNKTDLRTAANKLDREVQNLSKDPKATEELFTQLLGNLNKLPAEQAKVLWQEIGPSINQHIITDKYKFKEISDIMSTAKTKTEVDRATRLLRRLITAYVNETATPDQQQ
jgi:hypothetical protein